jgi:demethylmenaquinone methyltransferase/2-methoxy-6-polyprenyl-1,4-benzoquinol methylase
MRRPDLVEEMERYYGDRVPYHDEYMGYEGNEAMEALLRPVIELVEPDVTGRDVLEVACGTGNWTQVLSRRARSVVATDLFDGYLDVARAKPYARDNVTFVRADAYRLEGVGGPFDAAFCADWWSHMPRSRIGTFLQALHARLSPGARAVAVDMMSTEHFDRIRSHLDEEGNEVQNRTLPNGRRYQVVKNFPTEAELRERLGPFATRVSYVEHLPLKRWSVSWTVR